MSERVCCLARATLASDTGFSPVGPPWIRDDHVSSTSFKVGGKGKGKGKGKDRGKGRGKGKGKGKGKLLMEERSAAHGGGSAGYLANVGSP